MEAERRSKRLADVKANALVDALAEWPTEVEPYVLSEHWPM